MISKRGKYGIWGERYCFQRLILQGKIEGKRGLGRKKLSWLRNFRHWTGFNDLQSLENAAIIRQIKVKYNWRTQTHIYTWLNLTRLCENITAVTVNRNKKPNIKFVVQANSILENASMQYFAKTTSFKGLLESTDYSLRREFIRKIRIFLTQSTSHLHDYRIWPKEILRWW